MRFKLYTYYDGEPLEALAYMEFTLTGEPQFFMYREGRVVKVTKHNRIIKSLYFEYDDEYFPTTDKFYLKELYVDYVDRMIMNCTTETELTLILAQIPFNKLDTVHREQLAESVRFLHEEWY